MSAVFPTSIVSFTTKENKIDIVDADHVNKLQNEVIALESEIGLNVAGSKTDLVERLGIMQNTNGALANGSAFPTSAVDGQIYYRTDENTLYIYNGSSWDSQGQSLSNTLFQYSGAVYGSTGVGEYAGTGVYPATPANSNRFLCSAAAAYATTWTSKFAKISGISSIDVHVLGWHKVNEAQTFGYRVSVGSASGTFQSTGDQLVPIWRELDTIDLSGLVDGTTYDVVLEMKTSGGSNDCYCGGLIGIGR